MAQKLIRLVLPFIILGWAGCSGNNSSPSVAEIVGTYVGHYRGGDETFIIRGDGTFSQTFQRGSIVIYTEAGEWDFQKELNSDGDWRLKQTNGGLVAVKIPRDKRVVQVDIVEFKPFMIPYDPAHNYLNNRVGSGAGHWLRNPVRIEFGEWPYFIVKKN